MSDSVEKYKQKMGMGDENKKDNPSLIAIIASVSALFLFGICIIAIATADSFEEKVDKIMSKEAGFKEKRDLLIDLLEKDSEASIIAYSAIGEKWPEAKILHDHNRKVVRLNKMGELTQISINFFTVYRGEKFV